ncbi:MAG: hypothetical protein RJS97_02750 [Parvibaculaceae bacterium]
MPEFHHDTDSADGQEAEGGGAAQARLSDVHEKFCDGGTGGEGGGVNDVGWGIPRKNMMWFPPPKLVIDASAKPAAQMLVFFGELGKRISR